MGRDTIEKVIDGFGDEWRRFENRPHGNAELARIFEQYFAIFPWDRLPDKPRGIDVGCGTGRWAYFVADRVAELHCVEPSQEALEVARRNLADKTNCRLHHASAQDMPIADGSMDFGYALGVLHYVPDPLQVLSDCTRKLKPSAPFLLYAYYSFENRPLWFRGLWRASDLTRRTISRLPFPFRHLASQVIALTVYFPLARLARFLEGTGSDVSGFPLSAYRNRSLYVMRNDALNRFGAPFERRFTKKQLLDIMTSAGLRDVTFDDRVCWCALGYRE